MELQNYHHLVPINEGFKIEGKTNFRYDMLGIQRNCLITEVGSSEVWELVDCVDDSLRNFMVSKGTDSLISQHNLDV